MAQPLQLGLVASNYPANATNVKQLRYKLVHSNRLGILSLAVAGFLLVGGITTVVHGLQSQRSVASTQNLGDIPKLDNQPKAGYYLPYADPQKVIIPSIGVNSELITVGKTSDGHIDTPKHPNFDNAAWYRHSPAPGQYGASVIVGHIDSYENGDGASVFYNLAQLKPKDKIEVPRSDGATAIFEVYATRQYKRQSIPDNEVYGTNSGDAELRLITCAGAFDETTDEYDSNTVIFARLTSTHP